MQRSLDEGMYNEVCNLGYSKTTNANVTPGMSSYKKDRKNSKANEV